MTAPRDLVDVATDDSSGDLVVTAMGDLALAGGDDAIIPNVREAVTGAFYEEVGAPFFGQYIWLSINSPATALERTRVAAACRYALLYNELVDPTSIRVRWLDDAAAADEALAEVAFTTVASSAPRQLKFAMP